MKNNPKKTIMTLNVLVISERAVIIVPLQGIVKVFWRLV